MKPGKWHAHRGSLEEEFWKRIDKRGPDECWPWIGSKNSHGYGSFVYYGVRHGASAIAYKIRTGKDLEHLGCHSCDNPGCANPAHIFDGTHQENMDDMYAKGRGTQKKVDRNAVLKLKAGGLSGKEIARRLGCSAPIISKILRRNNLGRRKITEEMISKWVAARKSGVSCSKLAAEYGVRRALISRYTRDALRPYGRGVAA